MKHFFKISFILLAMMCLNAQPVSAKTSNKVYYVVIGSFSDLNNAIQKATSWTGKQPSIYKTTVKGKVYYRVCPSSFSTNAKAKSYIANNGIDGWVWSSNGAATCVWTPGESSSPTSSRSSSGSNYNSKTSTNNSTDSNSSGSSSTYSFYNSASVIDYLNHRYFECQGLRIKFSDSGFTVNGNYGGSAPVVKNFREDYAVIKVNLIPSGSLIFYVYPHQDKLIDTDGNTWRGYKSAGYER